MAYVIPLIVIFILTRKRTNKAARRIGDIGERKVAEQLSKLDCRFKVRNNFRCGRCQIDHVVFFGNEIFSIETKNWSGCTVGRKSDRTWTQNGEQRYNPIKQNKKHCEVLKSLYPTRTVHGIVVFTNGAFPDIQGVISDVELLDYIYESVSV